MTGLYITFAIIAGLILLLLVPVRLKVIFDGQAKIKIYYGILRVANFPGEVRAKRKPLTDEQIKKAEKKKQERKEKSRLKKEGKEEQGYFTRLVKQGGLQFIMTLIKDLLRLVKKLAKRSVRHTHITVRELYIAVGGEDSYKAATLLGNISAAVYPSLRLMQGMLNVKLKRVNIQPDFVNEQVTVKCYAKVWILPLFALHMVLAFGIKVLIKLIKTDRKLKKDKSVKAVQQNG